MLAQKDVQDLRRLAIGHYAAAALTLLMGLLYAGFFLLIGRLLQMAPEKPGSSRDAAAMEWMERVLAFAGITTAVYFLVVVAALVGVAVLVSRRQSYRLCLGLSALSATSLAMWCPFGPIAAGFTYRLMRRESIQAQFGDSGFPEGEGSRSAWDLRALSLGSYVLTGYSALTSILGVAAMAVMIFLMPQEANAGSMEQLVLFKALMVGVSLVFSLAQVAALGGLGYLLARAERRGICIALSILLLFFFPLGTAVGIFLLVVLGRVDVQAIFDGRRQPPTAFVENG